MTGLNSMRKYPPPWRRFEKPRPIRPVTNLETVSKLLRLRHLWHLWQLRGQLRLRLLPRRRVVQHKLVVDVDVRAQTVLVLEQLVAHHAVRRVVLVRVSDPHVFQQVRLVADDLRAERTRLRGHLVASSASRVASRRDLIWQRQVGGQHLPGSRPGHRERRKCTCGVEGARHGG